MKKHIVFLALSLVISSCSFMQEKPIDLSLKYSEDKGPKLNIKDYLNGNLEGYGFVENENGLITKRFTAQVQGTWDDSSGIVKRKFLFDNGEKDDNKTWLITLDKDNFSAVAHDVVGTAKGQQYKSVAQINYQIDAKRGESKERTKVSEVIYNIDNKSSISVLEFRSGFSYRGRMILSLHKVSSKPVVSFDKELDKELKAQPKEEKKKEIVNEKTESESLEVKK